MAEEGFKRKLTAILSADVAGYSRLMSEDESATVKTLETYREVMSTLIKQHRGHVIDSPGDNLLAEFTSVVDAVQCAVAVQKEFQARNVDLPENRRMEFRIGINLGDVIEEGDRIYGDGVNIAARLESLADPGGICVSKTAFDQIETKLPLGYEYLGEQSVKNIPKPVGAYRVLMEPRVTVAEEIEKKKALPVWRRKSILAGGVALALVVIAALIWNFYFRALREKPVSLEKMAFQLPDKPSIAVLPFDNLSANTGNDSLGDSISESIIYTLSYLPGMFVIARNSTFTYKGKPVEIRQVAEELGVQYVLEGSVMREKDRVRVTAQLIDAISGYHIWSGRFDRTMNNFFSLLDEITKTIAIELKVKVSEQWFDLSRKTNDFEAWASATRAYSLFTRGGGKNVVEAHALAEKAVALDPEYGFGWAILTAIHILEILYGITESPTESLKLAAECNEKALTLDPTLSCATASKGQICMLQGRIEEAIAFGEKAIAMAPRLETNHLIMATIMEFAGRFEEAIAYYKNVMRLNPFYPAGYLRRYGMSCLMAGRHEEALTVFKALLGHAQKGEYPPLLTHLGLCAVYAELGNKEEARTHASEILKIDPNFSLVAARKAYRWKDPSNTERWLSFLRKGGLPETPPLPLPDKPSIAMLPFTNMSDDPKQEYFSDGITENIITALSKVEKLFVIARNSTFAYKGKPVKVQQVAKDLGVQYVLEGSVQKSADRIRITAQLIDARKGHHLWAERYDRDLKDLFALQDEITMKIITALEVKLTEGEQAIVAGSGTDNLDAYLKILQARDLKRNQNIENNHKARRLAEEAIRLDPDYAQAYRWLSGTHLIDVWLGSTKSPQASLRTAMELAKKALSLDDSLGGAHGLLGNIYIMRRDYEKGIREAERAVELEPNGADAHAFLGMGLRFADRAEEAIPILKKAIRLDPHAPEWYLHVLAGAYREIEKYEEAIEWGEKAVQQNPENVLSRVVLCSIYSLAGRMDKAGAQGKEIIRLNPNISVERIARTDPQKNQVAKKRYIDALRKAGLK